MKIGQTKFLRMCPLLNTATVAALLGNACGLSTIPNALQKRLVEVLFKNGGISMQKIVVLNGSPRKQGVTAALAEEVSKAASDQGAEIKSYYLNGMNIKGCQSCYACKEQEHRCILRDDMQELYDEIDAADGIVFATPVYMWQMTAQLKQVIDRLYPFIKPDYSSYLAPGKKILLAVTQARHDTLMFHHYFEHMGKNLLFLGFGVYKILIAGGAKIPEDFYKQTEVVAEARRMGNWLAESNSEA